VGPLALSNCSMTTAYGAVLGPYVWPPVSEEQPAHSRDCFL
jgi:hypothetical protein